MSGMQAVVEEKQLLNSVRIDGQAIEKWHIQVEGRQLHIADDRGIYVFCTPISKYIDLEDELDALEDKMVDMGGFPHLVAQAQQEVNLELKKGCYYDVFVFGPTKRRGIRIIEGGRLATSPGEVPSALTLEETRFVALKNLEVALEKARGVKAKIVPMTAWGEYGRFIIVGLRLDEPDKKGRSHTIMVDHLGDVEYSHGYDRHLFLRFFR